MTELPVADPPFSLELIICTHNNASMLEATLEAISRQELRAAERWAVLVVDNNCTDNSGFVVERYRRSGKIPGLRVITETTLGLTPARACGVQNTAAPWIAFVDDDCILEPDWVAQAIKFASNHPGCGAFGGRVSVEWTAPPPDYVHNFKYAFAEQELGPCARRVGCLVGAGMVVNRAALAAVGWSDQPLLADRVGKKLVSGGDVEIALRIGSRYELWYNPACRLRHLIPASRTRKRYLRQINYGLGSSKLLGDSMLWNRRYLVPVLGAMREAGRQSVLTLATLLKAVLRRRPLEPGVIALYFWLGYWAGIWRLLWMDAQERGRLVGCASRAP
jgi:glycosyltransferase involved in cell wall biosynthesis